jgi:hypothetical protein
MFLKRNGERTRRIVDARRRDRAVLNTFVVARRAGPEAQRRSNTKGRAI